MDLIRENDLLPLLQEASEARFTDREWNWVKRGRLVSIIL